MLDLMATGARGMLMRQSPLTLDDEEEVLDDSLLTFENKHFSYT